MNLIGLAGRRRSGKDTAAAALIKDGYERYLFAGALKGMIRTLLDGQGVDWRTIERMVEGDLKEEPTPFLNGRSPRYAMQTIGTEWGRDLMSDTLWVDATMRAVKHSLKAVITDCRFPNEVAAIKAAGGVVVRIDRPGLGAADRHPSEDQIDQLDVDQVIVNYGTVEDLHRMVRNISIQ